jgi:hypothetical protein
VSANFQQPLTAKAKRGAESLTEAPCNSNDNTVGQKSKGEKPMSANEYINLIQAADSIEALERIVDIAANDDTITNAEYEFIYQTAVASV